MTITRRGLLTGIIAAAAAPAIIRTPGLLMPIRPLIPTWDGWLNIKVMRVTRGVARYGLGDYVGLDEPAPPLGVIGENCNIQDLEAMVGNGDWCVEFCSPVGSPGRATRTALFGAIVRSAVSPNPQAIWLPKNLCDPT